MYLIRDFTAVEEFSDPIVERHAETEVGLLGEIDRAKREKLEIAVYRVDGGQRGECLLDWS